ncbi:MAG: 50S ribosomal protein L11 methyltransferase [Alphaproteobacteria bacterium]|nr:50S ribosomal protein L11 methyltransferase [Alphaproteobacteria bacterium]
MARVRNLWIARVNAPAGIAAQIGDLLGENAVSQSVFAPPRVKMASIEAIFDHEPDQNDLESRLSIFALLNGISLPALEVQPAPPLDWLKKVSEDFPPLKIARWTVHGRLHRQKVPKRHYALQIDATNAFGTGEHPTTRGCLLMLDKILKAGFRPRRMADIGCGSGILAMACVEATRGLAAAVDMDADSVVTARDNARTNGVGAHIRLSVGKGYAPNVIKRHAPYDLIMANIFARPLAALAHELKINLRPGGMAILSGLLTTQANFVIAAHRMQGLALVEHKRIGEWSVLALKR